MSSFSYDIQYVPKYGTQLCNSVQCMNLLACFWDWFMTTDPVFNLTLLFLACVSDLTTLCVTKAFIKLWALFCFYSQEGNKMCFFDPEKVVFGSEYSEIHWQIRFRLAFSEGEEEATNQLTICLIV